MMRRVISTVIYILACIGFIVGVGVVLKGVSKLFMLGWNAL